MAVVSKTPSTISQLGILAAPNWAKDNGAWLKRIIEKHKADLKESQVEVFQAAYDGELPTIIERKKARGDGTEHKLQVNLAQVIIDTPVDYMLGKPPVWTVEDPEAVTDPKTGEISERDIVVEYRKEIVKLLTTEDAQRVLAEQLRQGGIAGYSVVIFWVDEKGNIDYEEFPVNECIAVMDTRGRFIMLIRYYQDEVLAADGVTVTTKIRVEVYDDKYITYYLANETGDGFELDDREMDQENLVASDEEKGLYVYDGNPVPHLAGRIPVSLFVNGQAASYKKRIKRAGTSDLGNGVLSLLEALAHGVSDKANLAEYLQDQYLLLKGVDVDEDEVLKMRKARALALKGENSDASFIAQDQEDDAIEHYLDRLENLAYDQTFTPKLKDLAGATATEVKMKYANLDIKVGKKEIYFMGAIKQFIQVLTDLLNAKRLIESRIAREDVYDILAGNADSPVELYQADWLATTLTRNLPQNYKEIADIVRILKDIVPESYLYELLWFIENPKQAQKEMKAQRDAQQKATMDTLYNSSANGEFNSTGGEGGEGGDTGDE